MGSFLGTFVKTGLLNAASSGGLPMYKIIEDAANWHEKGVLTEQDLKDIQTAMEKRAGNG